MSVKSNIDSELSHLVIDDVLREKIIQNAVTNRRYTNKRRKYSMIACVCLVLLFIPSVVVVSYRLYNNQICVGSSVLDVEQMHTVKVKKIEDQYNDEKNVVAVYSSYKELEKKLGVQFIHTCYEWDNSYNNIFVETDNKNWVSIEIPGFIIGDLTNVEALYVNKKMYFKGLSSENYQTPIDMKAFLIISDSQLKTFQGNDYLGKYDAETYVTKSGLKIVIIENKDVSIIPEIKAVFVKNGIQYELSGHVQKAKMKEILDSVE